jgi:hypothetical protein
MVSSAFRNLIDTQYDMPNIGKGGRVQKGTHKVAKAFLTYEEVVAQIEKSFCQEELNMMIAYLYSLELPTFEQQMAMWKKQKAENDALKMAEWKKAHPKGQINGARNAQEASERTRTREEVKEANQIDETKYSHGPARLWQGIEITDEDLNLIKSLKAGKPLSKKAKEYFKKVRENE